MIPDTDDWAILTIYLLAGVMTGLFIESEYRKRWHKHPEGWMVSVCVVLWPLFWATAILLAVGYLIAEMLNTR